MHPPRLSAGRTWGHRPRARPRGPLPADTCPRGSSGQEPPATAAFGVGGAARTRPSGELPAGRGAAAALRFHRCSGFTAAPAVPPARSCAGLAPREQPEGASAAAGLSEQPERRLTCGALSSCPPQLAKDLLHPSLENERRKHKKKRLVQSPNSYFMDVKCPGKHLKCLCLTEGVKLILYVVHLH